MEEAREVAAILVPEFACEWRAEATAALLAVLPEGDEARVRLVENARRWLAMMREQVGDPHLLAALLRRAEWRGIGAQQT